jgi:V8-like Glu-specific endopeptidase
LETKPYRLNITHFNSSRIHKFNSFSSTTNYVDPSVYNSKPYITTGKLYFNMGTQTAFCTASSAGDNIILTAGHCVCDGKGTYFSHFVFIPGFYDNNGPYGQWSATNALVSQEYLTTANLGRDIGFLKLKMLNQKKISEVIGFNQLTSCDINDK